MSTNKDIIRAQEGAIRRHYCEIFLAKGNTIDSPRSEQVENLREVLLQEGVHFPDAVSLTHHLTNMRKSRRLPTLQSWRLVGTSPSA